MRLTGAALAAVLMAGLATAQVPPSSPPIQALKDAASSGAPQAQYALAEAYRTGAGTLKDPDMAILWYKKAAAQGHTPSADALGLLLFVGGDRKTALPLLQAAAARGNARALYVLGTAHFNGDAVPRDRTLAYAELSRAAPTLAAAKRNLDLVRHYLTPDELARGDALLARPTLPIASAPLSPTIEPPAQAPHAAAPIGVTSPRPSTPFRMEQIAPKR